MAITRVALTLDEVAEAAGVSRTRVKMAIRDQQLTAHKAGRVTLVLVEDLRAWLSSLPTTTPKT